MTGPRTLVLDASSTCNWLFNEDGNADRSDQLLIDAAILVPSLWQLEVLQVLRRRQTQLSAPTSETATFIRSLESLDVVTVPPTPTRSLLTHHAFAQLHGLTPYDAVYLELALDRRLPLLTHDKNLIRAARAAKVELITV